VPLGTKSWMRSMGIENCEEMDWWHSYHYLSKEGKTIEILFTPTKHWTARSLFDRNSALWGSYSIFSKTGKFFFTGDTAYCSIFEHLGAKYGPYDLAAIPIGAYAPRWFMKDVHCNPEEAVRIHQDLRAKQSVAIHWGTFPLADEDYIEPALELARIRDIENIPSNVFASMAHGETITFGEVPSYDLASIRNDLYGMYLNSLRFISQENFTVFLKAPSSNPSSAPSSAPSPPASSPLQTVSRVLRGTTSKIGL
jgi:N-acyl-phosphatidylethanolamine-hydrolysing phospholipase D